jgi:uncharacterized protein (TIGR02996 family)
VVSSNGLRAHPVQWSSPRSNEMRLAAKAKERVRREFFPEDYERALQVLSSWDTKACAPGEGPSRMHAAILNLALGNVSYLERSIAAAQEDFRDVLLGGEYSEGKHLRGVVCEPSEGATDPTEEAFLDSIRASPAEIAPRLVYADWLEERGDPRVDYVRVLCEWLACRPAGDQALIERERELRARLSRRWLARIRGMPVREKPVKKRV